MKKTSSMVEKQNKPNLLYVSFETIQKVSHTQFNVY